MTESPWSTRYRPTPRRTQVVQAITAVIGNPGQDLWVDGRTADDIADAVFQVLAGPSEPQEKP